MKSSGDFGEDFGQKVDLTASIRNILRNYPEGTAILKELVQNADDAGARVVRFCLDHRNHPTSKLADPALAQFQGPSLMVYNSAVFTEEDFKSIQRIGDSLKNSEETSKTKIGRFGIGFNAVYHWTELPSFISDRYLVMLDPQARFLPNVNPSNPGKIVNWVDNRAIFNAYADQFVPYSTPGMNWSKPFQGTLFRLPLRTAEQAQSSYLSKRAITDHDVADIIQNLIMEATTMLLFLRNVEKIEIQEWYEGASEPRQLYSCEINGMTTALRTKRSFDAVLGRNRGASLDPNKVICEDYSLEIKITSQNQSSSPSTAAIQQIEKWEICTQFGGGQAMGIARDPRNTHMKLVPLAGTAACVQMDGDQRFQNIRKGLAYCFLPLPIQTELPIMVNGFFELSSNRRDIWQSGADMTGDGYTRANWNLALLKDVVSPCYARLLMRLKEFLGYTKQYQGFWPSHTAPQPWSLVTSTTLSLCQSQKLLAIQSSTALSWIEPINAVVVPFSDGGNQYDELYAVLDHYSAPVIRFQSSDLHQTLIKLQTCPTIATPAYLRKLIRSKQASTQALLPMSFCKFVVQYCLSDQNVQRITSELHDLKIIPLLSNSVGLLKIFDRSQMEAIQQLNLMGYSLQDSISALLQCRFDVMQSCEMLSDTNARHKLLSLPRSCFILAGAEELEVFRDASTILIDNNALHPNEIEFIGHEKFQLTSNIRRFQPSLAKDLLAEILPPVCMTGQPFAVSPSQVEKLSRFILDLWKYLSIRSEIIGNLVEGPSLLPLVNFTHLLSISRISNVIVPKRGDQEFPQEILNILKLISVPLVSVENMGCDLNAMPSVFWDYVHPPTRKGILNVVSFQLRSTKTLFQALDDNARNTLRIYLANGIADLGENDFSTIESFPIFPVFGEENKLEPIFTALNDSVTKKSSLFTLKDFQGIPTEWFPKNMVYHVAIQELSLLQRLRLPLMQKSEFFMKIVLPNVASYHASNPSLYQESILHMLLELQQLLQEDRSLFQALRTAKFIPTSVNVLASAQDLFDPAEQEMINLLDDSYFPTGPFRAEEVLVILRSLGLKSIIDWDGIIASAKSVALIDDEEVEVKQQKGKYLLRYLDKNVDRLLGEEKKAKNTGFSLFSTLTSLFVEKGPELSPEQLQRYILELRKIAWLPAMITPMYSFMPWVENPGPCAPPQNCAGVSDGWLCSSTRRLVQEPIHSENLRKILGWGNALPDQVFAKQIIALSKTYSSLSKSTSNAEVTEFRQILNGLIAQLYRKLDGSPEIDMIRGHLQDIAWIWMGQHFVNANKVAIQCSVNVAPYLYALPEELKGYQRLLSIFNIKSHFSFRDYIAALGEMAMEYGVTPSSVGEPLSDSLLDVTISLVTLIAAENTVTLQSQTIFVPDSTGRLAESTMLMNDDVPWLVGPEFIGIRSTCRFIHANVSSKVAEKLGVKSLRTSLVSTNVEQTLFGGLQVNNFESFGQAESLTNRLKTILDLYPDGSPILNELIQNADDAGASIVRFLVDENSYGKESLMDSRMEQLQGPSLIIQNDARFTEADFRSLASVGQGSKLEKLATTGRFGLGFNSTYHITDTPMFVSGDYFVFFDPHCAYVPGSTINQPGIRIKFSNTNLKKVFPNQFQPFLQYGFDCENAYYGTLFRFPLRTMAQAKKSEICKRSYKLSDLDSIIDQLVDNLSSILLFLRSVKVIEIYRLPEGQTSPVLVHSVNSAITSKTTENDQSLLAYFDKTAANLGQSVASSQALSKVNFYNQLLSVPDERLPITLLTKLVTVKTVLLQENSVTSEVCENREYIIVQGLRGGRAKKLACSETARDLKLIPYGGIAACISSVTSGKPGVGYDKLWLPCQDGQVFCFLPTPIKSTLQVHINAYWELSSNRRDIWRGEDTKGEAKLRSDWNQYIMEDVLAPLYCKLLVYLNDSVIQKNTNISRTKVYDLLPCPLPPQPWDGLAKALYPLLKPHALLWSNLSGGRYLRVGDCYLLDTSDVRLENKELERLEQLLLQEGLPIAVVNKDMITCLSQGQCIRGIVDSELVRKTFHVSVNRSHPIFDRTNNPNNTWTLIVENAIFLLNYCLLDIQQSKQGYTSLFGLKLLPLENQSMGIIGSNLDGQWYFLANDIERTLLNRCQDKIMVNPSLFPTDLIKHFESTEFLNVCNIRKIQSVDVLKLLCSIIPKHWLDHNSVICQRVPQLSDEWFHTLWKYILENNLVELFADVFPLIPVHFPGSFVPNIQNPISGKSGSLVPSSNASIVSTGGLAKISKRVPVVIYSTNDKEYLKYIIEGLGLIGVFVLDESLSQPFLANPDFQKLLQERSAKGLLGALKTCASNILKYSNQWSPRVKLALRNFILTEILDKLEKEELLQDEKELLCSLPIWLTHRAIDGEISKAFPSWNNIYTDAVLGNLPFSFLNTAENYLGPNGVAASLLDEKYIWVDTTDPQQIDKESKLINKLGIKQLSLGEYFTVDVLERIIQGKLASQDLRSIGFICLNKLKILEEDQPGISKSLGSCPMFPNGHDELVAANQMYDPDVGALSTILPAGYFPRVDYSKDPTLFMSLRQLGLKKEIDCEGILAAARSIEQDQKTMIGALSSSGTASNNLRLGQSIESHAMYKSTLERSRGIMRYLDSNVDRLLEDCDPDGLERFRVEHRSKKTSDSSSKEDNSSESNESNKNKLGASWGNEIRSTWWVSVFTKCPEVFHGKGLPWPNRVHSTPFAAPCQASLSSNMWLASSTLRICSGEVQSPLLLALLGWDQPVGGNNIAIQLSNMSLDYQTVIESQSASRMHTLELMKRSYDEIFPSILSKLNDRFECESQLTVNHWISSLSKKSILWVASQGRFVESNRFALKSVLSINTEPFLYVVPSNFQHYEKMLLALGVKSSFQAVDLANFTVQLYQQHGSQSLNQESAAIHIGIIDVMFQLLEAEINKATSVTSAELTTDSGAVLTVEESAVEAPIMSTVSTEGTPKIKVKPEHIKSLGPIYVPDRNNCLALTTTLHYKDATWISDATLADKFRSLRFVHSKIDIEMSELLGCKSLRELLYAGEDVICPSVKQLKSLIEDDTVKDMLCDYLHLADLKNSEMIEVIFDSQNYPCESLLHPGLGAAQGPALLIHLPHCMLSFEDINHMLLLPTFTSAETGNPVKAICQSGELFPALGKRLLSSFGVTDCLQILTGSELYVFDPSGSFLQHDRTNGGNSSDIPGIKPNALRRHSSKLDRINQAAQKQAGSASDGQPKAQRYKLNGKKATTASTGGLATQTSTSQQQEQNLLTSFGDQFTPFVSVLSENMRTQLVSTRTYNGTIIRLPLRSNRSPLSRNVISANDIASVFGSFKGTVSAALVFARTLRSFSLFRSTENNQRLFTYSVEVNPNCLQDRANRLKLIQSSGWERQGLVKMFSNYVPPEYSAVIKVVTRVGEMDWLSLNHTMKLTIEHLIATNMNGSLNQMAIEDQFFVYGCMGFSPIKDFAISEPYRGLRLLPFVTIAVPLIPLFELVRFDIAPDSGVQIYNTCITAITGLPFHTEGFFLHQDNKRPFPVAPKVGGVAGNIAGKVNIIQQWNDAIFATALKILYPKALQQMKQLVVSSAMSSRQKERHLAGFYKYWIYQPRLHPLVKNVVKTSGIFPSLCAVDQPNFLLQTSFTTVDKAVLPLFDLSRESATYLASTLNLANCPIQIGHDLQENRIACLELTPERLRAYLRRDVAIHAGTLPRSSRFVWRELVQYVIQDLDMIKAVSATASVGANTTSDGEFSKKRNLKKLAGCPLLLTADEKIKCFPNNVNERKAYVPLAFYDFLPNDLFGHIINSLMMECFGELLTDPCCQEVLFISSFNAHFVKHMVQFFLPPSWSMNKVIHWIPSADAVHNISNGQCAIQGYPSLRHFELLVYCMWNLVFMKETAVGLSPINDLPLLPVVCNGRRLLIPVEAIKYIFVSLPNAFEDRYRQGLKQEVTAASANATSRRGQALLNSAESESCKNDWKWTQRRAAADELVSVDESLKEEVAAEDEEIIREEDVEVEVTSTSSLPAVDDSQRVDASENEMVSISTDLPSNSYSVISRVGLPFLDGYLFEGTPVAAQSNQQLHHGAKILEALYYFKDNQFTIYDAHDASTGSILQAPLVDFNILTVTDRTKLLLDMHAAHRTESFSESNMQKLRSLPLFTNCFDSVVPIVLNECRNGLYWCSDEQVLQTWRSREQTTASATSAPSAAGSAAMTSSETSAPQPVVLAHNPQLRDVYRWLQIQELTPSIAVSQFMLPMMNTMPCVERIQLIKRLASNWGTYKSDRSLVDALKTQPFIPMWTMTDPEGWQHESTNMISAETTIRRCDELILWTNGELMECLHGESLPKYFAPPSLRTPELHSLFSDLGMKAEVTSETFLTIVTDIQTDALAAQQSNPKDETKLHDCIQRGRKVLHYILSGDRASALFDNNTFARKVGKIMFVPMKTPLQIEEGGFVVYQDDVGRFDQFISKPHGMTAFSVLPILEEDVTPSTIYFSSLGIMNAPNREVVLRHVRNLIKSNHLERWNISFYTPQQTFNAIFQYLSDNWRSLSQVITDRLKEEAIIPVGNLLVPPNRIFFRLTEDLAPFMHELPRQFGAHEAFLKTSLGIREAPGSMDYVHFMNDLAKELRTASLNPNELRAIVTISQTISNQLENIAMVGTTQSTAGGNPRSNGNDEQQLLQRHSQARKKFFIPDENSIMRNIDQCIVNDDSALRSKIGNRLEQLGLFVIHPLLASSNAQSGTGSSGNSTSGASSASSNNFGKILQLHSLTELFKEKLEDSRIIPLHRIGSDAELGRKYHAKMNQVFNDSSFLSIITSLVARNQYEKSSSPANISSSATGNAKSSTSAEFSVQHQLNELLELRFVQDLATTLVLVNPADPRQESLVFGADSNDNLDKPLFYLDQTRAVFSSSQQRSILYLNVGKSNSSGISIELAIALGLCQLFHLDRIFASMIAELMSITDHNARMNLAEVYHLKDNFQATQFLLRGSPGALLTSADLSLIELRPMRLYRVGEIVAYEENEENGGSTNSKYYYGKVIAVGEANELGVRKLDVKTGRGVQKFLSTSIYAFKSARGTIAANEGLSTPSTVISWMTNAIPIMTSSKQVPDNPTAITPLNVKQESDVIGKDELLSALHGLLDRAGFPVTLNQKEMMAKIFELEAQNQKAEEILKSERQQQVQLRQTLEQQLEAFKCSICLTNNVDHVLVPCGHTFCEECANHLQHNKCHYCRTMVQRKVKMFIGTDNN